MGRSGPEVKKEGKKRRGEMDGRSVCEEYTGQDEKTHWLYVFAKLN
jgi:hypothetical protein